MMMTHTIVGLCLSSFSKFSANALGCTCHVSTREENCESRRRWSQRDVCKHNGVFFVMERAFAGVLSPRNRRNRKRFHSTRNSLYS